MTTQPNTPATPAAAKKTRTVRTPQQKAQDRVKAAADRQMRAKKELDRASRIKADAETAFDAAQAEVQAADAAYKFESGHPDLKPAGGAA